MNLQRFDGEVPGMRTTAPAPPRYLNCTINQLRDSINRRGPKFTQGDHERAWTVLGYNGSVKPDQNDFEVAMDYLWECLFNHGGRRKADVEARSRVLEALKTLGYSCRKWKTGCASLDIREYTNNPNWRQVDDFPVYNEGRWQDLENPRWPGKKPYQKDAEQVIKDAYEERPNDRLSAIAIAEAEVAECMVWTRMCIYNYGFYTQAEDGTRVKFLGYAVPRGGGSHHLGRNTPDGRKNCMLHWQAKAAVWAYFTQVLHHPEHPRWRDYVALEVNSRRNNTSPVSGTTSLLRHLHCNEEMHGRHVQRVHPSMFYVLADFFGLQVVVFTPNMTQLFPTPMYTDATPHTMRPDKSLSSDIHWTCHLFGFMDGDCTRSQLFLATTDGEHYDPVAPEDMILPGGRPRPQAPDGWFIPFDEDCWHRGEFPYPKGDVPRLDRLWPLPCRNARHPFPATLPRGFNRSPDEHDWPTPDGMPRQPREVHGVAHYDNVEGWVPDTQLWGPDPGRMSMLDEDKYYLFRCGIDIPGNRLEGLPDEDAIAQWDAHIDPNDVNNYHITRSDDSREQIRFGGDRNNPPPPSMLEDISTSFIETQRNWSGDQMY
ncbi:hypothetical protein B0T24DRAFT_661300 [Lasiosphaeria ovina]|uniref:Uncharacterized protein n=1 Tax=Lasiosphaeria ovina TaxID=92902 RepID=A0AAE0NJE1_9PEZI|nr:hypothetical protein B0T24DRAFT_661300 [Lasiosphaeria ovina]